MEKPNEQFLSVYNALFSLKSKVAEKTDNFGIIFQFDELLKEFKKKAENFLDNEKGIKILNSIFEKFDLKTLIDYIQAENADSLLEKTQNSIAFLQDILKEIKHSGMTEKVNLINKRKKAFSFTPFDFLKKG